MFPEEVEDMLLSLLVNTNSCIAHHKLNHIFIEMVHDAQKDHTLACELDRVAHQLIEDILNARAIIIYYNTWLYSHLLDSDVFRDEFFPISGKFPNQFCRIKFVLHILDATTLDA